MGCLCELCKKLGQCCKYCAKKIVGVKLDSNVGSFIDPEEVRMVKGEIIEFDGFFYQHWAMAADSENVLHVQRHPVKASECKVVCEPLVRVCNKNGKDRKCRV